ncbi:MAG TPA: hypothetical protein PK370_00390 [Candidatus Woesebacteria bacterium]|nr:hypothetical protein [Candidatus Woesebacteria bacterium]HPJ16959.1 hypothetical protein [Candidatus Woesebacteria bacterium]
MSLKQKQFKFSFAVLLRLIIFGLFLIISINYLSHNQTNVLGDSTLNIDLSPYLPKDISNKFQDFQKTPVFHNYETIRDQVQTQLNGFPQKQIKEIKKEIVKSIYQDIIKSIDQP